MLNRIRQRIGQANGDGQGDPRGDFDLNPHADGAKEPRPDLRPAAVLVPIVDRPEGTTVLLTQRSDHLDHHPGQVSFPGGRIEEHDEDVVAAALRETEEEIGLARSFVEIVGPLDQYRTGTGFDITPVVGLVRPGFTLTLDAFEVAEVFEVALDFVLDPANHKRESQFWKGEQRHYYVFPHDDYYIWGATAGMLVNLYDKLRD
jgi:8-oxo-dGTP pyrophosphatase MutT (NUDIX family)